MFNAKSSESHSHTPSLVSHAFSRPLQRGSVSEARSLVVPVSSGLPRVSTVRMTSTTVRNHKHKSSKHERYKRSPFGDRCGY